MMMTQQMLWWIDTGLRNQIASAGQDLPDAPLLFDTDQKTHDAVGCGDQSIAPLMTGGVETWIGVDKVWGRLLSRIPAWSHDIRFLSYLNDSLSKSYHRVLLGESSHWE
jgi:hypothetical protein